LKEIIHPNSLFLRAFWNPVFALGTAFHCIEVPLRIAMGYDVPFWLWALDIFFVIVFFADIYIQNNKGFFSYGQFIFDPSLIRRHYMQRKGKMDLLYTFPIGSLLLAMGFDVGVWFRLNHCLRLPRVFSLYRLRTPLLEQNFKVKVFQYVMVGAIGFHWIGCGWLLVNDYQQSSGLPVHSVYIEAIYWSVTTLTTVGYGDITPFSDLARVYTMLVMILGVGVYAFVIGNISSLLVKVDAIQEAQKRKINLLADYMQHCHVPDELQGEVFGYYNHFLDTHPSRDNEVLLKDLPESMKKRLETYSHMKLINGVPILDKLSSACKEDLASNLELVVYSPGQSIISYGEEGHEMFFVDHGNVEVLSPSGEKLKSLEAGDHFFRETALLKEVYGRTRVRAINYCGLYRLNESSFQEVVLKHEGSQEEENTEEV